MGYSDIGKVVNMSTMHTSTKGYTQASVPLSYVFWPKNEKIDDDVYAYVNGPKPVTSLSFIDGSEYKPFVAPYANILNLYYNYGRSLEMVFTDFVRYSVENNKSYAYNTSTRVPPVGFIHVVALVSSGSYCHLRINGVVLSGTPADWSTKPLRTKVERQTTGPTTYWDQDNHTWTNSAIWNVSSISNSAVDIIYIDSAEAVRSKTYYDVSMNVRNGSDQSITTHVKFDLQQRSISGYNMIVARIVSDNLYSEKYFASGSNDLTNGGFWLPMCQS